MEATRVPLAMPVPKGHWPKGKRRNVPGCTAESLSALRLKVGGVLEADSGSAIRRDPLAWSRKSLAAWLGVSDRTLRRWLAGEDFPPAGHVTKLRVWLRTSPPPPRRATGYASARGGPACRGSYR
jgi:hypothetical protein